MLVRPSFQVLYLFSFHTDSCKAEKAFFPLTSQARLRMSPVQQSRNTVKETNHTAIQFCTV